MFKKLTYYWRRFQRAREASLWNIMFGLYLRRRFTKAGFVQVKVGWPLPDIQNFGGSIEVGNVSFFPGVRIECWRGASIKIGRGTYINRNTEIIAATSVVIGADCKIARDVLIMDTDQHPIGDERLINKAVEIGDRAWIGSRAIVLKGVTIGHDSMVGAGAVVTKNVPPYSVVVGPAAQVVRSLRFEAEAQN